MNELIVDLFAGCDSAPDGVHYKAALAMRLANHPGALHRKGDSMIAHHTESMFVAPFPNHQKIKAMVHKALQKTLALSGPSGGWRPCGSEGRTQRVQVKTENAMQNANH